MHNVIRLFRRSSFSLVGAFVSFIIDKRSDFCSPWSAWHSMRFLFRLTVWCAHASLCTFPFEIMLRLMPSPVPEERFRSAKSYNFLQTEIHSYTAITSSSEGNQMMQTVYVRQQIWPSIKYTTISMAQNTKLWTEFSMTRAQRNKNNLKMIFLCSVLLFSIFID